MRVGKVRTATSVAAGSAGAATLAELLVVVDDPASAVALMPAMATAAAAKEAFMTSIIWRDLRLIGDRDCMARAAGRAAAAPRKSSTFRGPGARKAVTCNGRTAVAASRAVAGVLPHGVIVAE